MSRASLQLSTCIIASLALLAGLFPISAACQDEQSVDYSTDLATVDIYAPDEDEGPSRSATEYSTQAWKAYQAGDYESAAAFFHLAMRRGSTDSGTLYNLACCYGLLAEAELAGRYLAMSVDAGFENAYSLQNDPDFAAIREDSGFADLVEQLVQQTEERRAASGQQVFIPADTFHPAWVKYPDDYDPQRSYRLLVGLHGFGSNPQSFMGIRERFADPDFIMVCPQAPYVYASTGDPGFSWAGWTNQGGLPVESFETSQAYIDELISQMRRTHNISSVYLFGFSQGAMMSVYQGLSSPVQVHGVIAFGGSLWDFLIGDGLLRDHPGKLRWFIAHGSSDTVVPYAEGQALADALREAGHDVTWHEFDGAHSVPEDIVKIAEQWMRDGDAD